MADPDQSLLSTLRDAGYSSINAPCGGNGTCKQCGVTVTGEVLPVDGSGQRTVSSERILACRHRPASDLFVIVPDTEKISVVTSGAGDIAPQGEGLGVAVDIGTTTVALYLYDLATGKRLAVESDRNAQRPFGADVLSRIVFSSVGDGLTKLSAAIRNQLDRAIDAACRAARRKRAEIRFVSIAGNTVMEHIFVEYSPVGIGVAPFTPVSLFGDLRPADGFFKGLAEGAQLYMCPALAGYVGGDITAGLLSSGAWQESEPCLFIDIGTNGEMGVGDKNGFTCCATAAGPAFEGAEIECGMDGSKGAINTAAYENGEVVYTVIGDVEAAGICGSGLIDALVTMLRCGAVEESGRMVPPEEAPENIAHRIRRGEDGGLRFYFSDKVYVSAMDVRQLQLAKAAIRGGIETLLALRGKGHGDISSVLIAGGFGAYMDVKSACAIGLLPPTFVEKTKHVGNSAGAGAALALGEESRQELSRLTERCEYLELSSSALFMEKYIDYMVFDEVGEVFN